MSMRLVFMLLYFLLLTKFIMHFLSTSLLAFCTSIIYTVLCLTVFLSSFYLMYVCMYLQVWQATSIYSLSDYTGEYKLELVPCTAPPEQAYVVSEPPSCTPHPPQAFTLPLAIQQSHRPVPLVYTLNTVFQLFNTPDLFLQDPRKVDNLQVKAPTLSCMTCLIIEILSGNYA